MSSKKESKKIKKSKPLSEKLFPRNVNEIKKINKLTPKEQGKRVYNIHKTHRYSKEEKLYLSYNESINTCDIIYNVNPLTRKYMDKPENKKKMENSSKCQVSVSNLYLKDEKNLRKKK